MNQIITESNIDNFRIARELLVEDEKLVKRLALRLQRSTIALFKPNSDIGCLVKGMRLCRKADKLLKKDTTLETYEIVDGLLLQACTYFHSAESDLYDLCVEQYEQAQTYYIQRVRERANGLFESAECQFSLLNYKDAKSNYEESVQYFKKLGQFDKAKEAQEKANLCERKIYYGLAKTSYEQADQARINEDFDNANKLIVKAKMYYEKANFDIADIEKCDLFIIRCAEEEAEMVKRCTKEGDKLLESAKQSYVAKDFSNARYLYLQALKQYQKAKYTEHYAVINRMTKRCDALCTAQKHHEKGLACYNSQDYERAMEYFDKACSIYEDLNRQESDCDEFLTRSHKYYVDSKNRYACALFEKAERYFNQSDYNQAIEYFSMAKVYGYDRYVCENRIKDCEEEIRLEKERLEEERREEERYEEEERESKAQSLYDDAEFYYRHGDYDRARVCLKDAEDYGYDWYDCKKLREECDEAEEAENAENEQENNY